MSGQDSQKTLFEMEPYKKQPQQKRSKGRQKFLPLMEPNPSLEDVKREDWLEEVCSNFVCPSRQNHEYYRIILELLWPEGYGIPGPYVQQSQIREAINRYRESVGKERYNDPFRRFRELQGEEGVTGIAREGNVYQLVSLALSPKRDPRTALGPDDWEDVLVKYGYKCAACGRKEPEVRFQQDHKIPRVRGGSPALSNWQPLCDECNNFKSVACRGCTLDCEICPWAFPESYAPLRVKPEIVKAFRELAAEEDVDPTWLVNLLLAGYIRSKK